MGGVREFIPRGQSRMGEVVVEVTVTNGRDPARKKRFDAVVDTGATGLILPLAWKEELGELESLAMVDEICGVVIDLVSRRLIARRSLDLKSAACA